MGYTYAVLGAGRQGTAAAYDLIKLGDADRVLLADQSLDAAHRAADRVANLLHTDKAVAVHLDVTDYVALTTFLDGVDAFLSAVPYYLNYDIARAAVHAGASMCDLGGNVDVVRRQLELDAAASAAGISIVPDCGQVPGMGTTLIVHAMNQLDEVDDVMMWDGGLPQEPRPPFNYFLTFHAAGLTNEYAEPPIYLRDGKVTQAEALAELETIDFPPPIGRLEAFTSAGGVSTLPWTYEGKVRTIHNKTLRYPGHHAQLRAFFDLGLMSQEPVVVDGQEIVPRRVFETLFEQRVIFPDDKDLCIIHIRATGRKEGRPAEAIVSMIDYHDDATGFRAMERTTGWDGAIVAAMMARGQTPRGAHPVEVAVPPDLFVQELECRGIQVDTRLNYLP
ncbi:MAG TPA: saccharopine dehydrogenase C-terminal domain-containing protein [Anaerolineae bacterium]|nr:saccharopine dehydrogenase C-terminal domain-containing protein [Anaerolineae bacterium]